MTALGRTQRRVDYMFPRPGQTALSHKWTYVKRVTLDGAPALLGAGFYPD
jgi:hypothetical protein